MDDRKRSPSNATKIDRCRNLYQFIRLRVGDALSDREIARRWQMEWKSFSALKHGRRHVPRVHELERLAVVLGVDPDLVFRVSRGVPASEAVRMDEQQRTLQLVFDCVPAACILFERDGTISSANPLVEGVCHLNAAEIIGRNAIEVFGNPGPAGCPVTRAFLTGKIEQQISRVTNRAGQKAYVHRTAGPIVSGGEVQRVIEIMVDVTEQIRHGDLRVLSLWREQPELNETGDVSERRASPRADVAFEARCLGGDQKPAQVAIRNLSAGGLFAESRVPTRTGARVRFEWSLPGDRARVRASGVVVWSQKGTSRQPGGMGVRFSKISPPLAPIARADQRKPK